MTIKTVFLERLTQVINRSYRGNVKAFANDCIVAGGADDAPSYETVRKYLSGAEPTLTKMVVMARAAGVSLDWLAGLTDEKGAAPRKEQPQTDEEKLNALRRRAELIAPGAPQEQVDLSPGFVVQTTDGEAVVYIDLRFRGREDPIPVTMPGLQVSRATG